MSRIAIQVRGAVGPLSGLPVFDHDEFCDRLADIVGDALKPAYFIDPAVAQGKTRIKNRGGPRGVYALATPELSPVVQLADPTFNGQATMDFSALPSSTDLAIVGSTQSLDVSYLVVVRRPALSTSGTAKAGTLVAGQLADAKFPQKLRLDDGGLWFDPGGGALISSSSILIVPHAQLPAPGALMVVGLTYNHATLSSSLWVNGTLKASRIHPAGTASTPNLAYSVAGSRFGASTSGFKDKMGRCMIWKRDMSAPDAAEAWSLAQELMLETYGLI